MLPVKITTFVLETVLLEISVMKAIAVNPENMAFWENAGRTCGQGKSQKSVTWFLRFFPRYL